MAGEAQRIREGYIQFESCVREIAAEERNGNGGAVALEQVAALLRRGSWDDVDVKEAAKSKADLQARLAARAKVREHASRLCCIAASVVDPDLDSFKASRADTTAISRDDGGGGISSSLGTGSSIDSSSSNSNSSSSSERRRGDQLVPFTRRSFLLPEKTELHNWCHYSDRFRDKLMRTVVGVPSHPPKSVPGKLQPWVLEGLQREPWAIRKMKRQKRKEQQQHDDSSVTATTHDDDDDDDDDDDEVKIYDDTSTLVADDSYICMDRDDAEHEEKDLLETDDHHWGDEPEEEVPLEDWCVGDATLVWWCKGWFPASVFEISDAGNSDGGLNEERRQHNPNGASNNGGMRLRLRLHGHNKTSDLWVHESEWPIRLRPLLCVAQGGGRLALGANAREGDTVSVQFSDCVEHHYWNRRRCALLLRDGVDNSNVAALVAGAAAGGGGEGEEVNTMGLNGLYDSSPLSSSSRVVVKQEETKAHNSTSPSRLRGDIHPLNVRRLTRQPVGRVIRPDMVHDSTLVDLHLLGVTEPIMVPNCLMMTTDAATYEDGAATVAAVRHETRRLLEAILAGATLSGDAASSLAPVINGDVGGNGGCIAIGGGDDAEEAKERDRILRGGYLSGSRVWQGVQVVSGRRVCVSVRRTGGDVLFSTLLLDNNDDGDNDGGDRSEKDVS